MRRHSLLLLRLPGVLSSRQLCEPVHAQSVLASTPHAEAGPSSQHASAQHVSSTAPVQLGLPWLGLHSVRSMATGSRLLLRGSKGLGLRRRQAEASRGAAQRGIEDEDSLASSYYSRDEEPWSGRGSRRGRHIQDLDEMPPMAEPRRRPRSGRAAEEGLEEDDEGMRALSRAQLKAQQKSMRRGSMEFEEMGQAYSEPVRGEPVTAPRRARNKSPTPEMNPRASHAEFYGDRAGRGGSPTQARNQRAVRELWGGGSEREASEGGAWSGVMREKRSPGRWEGQEAVRGGGGAHEPKTLAQLQRQASQVHDPRQVLALIEDACKLLDDMRANIKPSSPQLTKQVAGVHELLNSLMLRILPPSGIDKLGADAAQSQSTAAAKAQRGFQGPTLLDFHGLGIARCMRLLGKAGVVAPPAVREALVNELLEDGCHKLLAASPIAWVQALQGMHLLRSASAAQHYASMRNGGSREAARVAQEEQQKETAEAEAWSVPAAKEGEEAAQQHTGAELAHTSGSSRLAAAEQDLLEVLSSMLVSAPGHLEPDTVVMLGSYLAQLSFSGKTEVYKAIAATVATESHRLSDRSGSQLGMMARSLATTKAYVPELLDELAAFVEARKGSFVTSQGWPDLLRAFATFSHPCPGLIRLLSDSIHSHAPVLQFKGLSSLALSISLLDKELTPPSLRILQAVCDAIPSRMSHPDATGGVPAMYLIQALAATRFRDPACLGALAPAATSAWLPHMAQLAQTVSQEAQHLQTTAHEVQQSASHDTQQTVSHDEHQQQQQQPSSHDTQHEIMFHEAQQQQSASLEAQQQQQPSSHDIQHEMSHEAQQQQPASHESQHHRSVSCDTQHETASHEAQQHPTNTQQPAPDSEHTSSSSPPLPQSSPSSAAAQPEAGNAEHAPSSLSSNPSAAQTPSTSPEAVKAAGTHAQPSHQHTHPSDAHTHIAYDLTTTTSSPPSPPSSAEADSSRSQPHSMDPHGPTGAMNSDSKQGPIPDNAARDSEVLASAKAAIARAQQLAAAVSARMPHDTLQAYGRTTRGVRGLSQLAYTQGTQVPQLLQQCKVMADAGMVARYEATHLAITTAEILADTLSSSSSSSSESGGGSVQPEHIADLQDALLAFVRCSLGGPLTVSPQKEAPEINLCHEDKHDLDLHRVYDADARPNASRSFQGTVDATSVRYLLSMSLSTLRALGLGQALWSRPGLNPIPPPAGLPAHAQPQIDSAARPVTADGIFVYMLLGGQCPVQEALYRPPATQEQASASLGPMHTPSGEHWQAAPSESEGTEPAWRSLSPQNLVREERGHTGETHGVDEAGHDGEAMGDEGGEGAGSGSAVGQGDNSSNSSISGSSSSSSSSSGSPEQQEQEFNEGARGVSEAGEAELEGSGSDSSTNDGTDIGSNSSESDAESDEESENVLSSGDGGSVGWGEEVATPEGGGTAGLESLLLRAGADPDSTRFSPCHTTLHLAATLSSVLLGQGLSTPATQRLLLAHGRMVLAGAVHSDSTVTAHTPGSSDSSSSNPAGAASGHNSNADTGVGSGSSGSSDSSSSGSGSSGAEPSSVMEAGEPRSHVSPPDAPIAVLLVGPVDFCHQSRANAHGPSHSSGVFRTKRSGHAALLDRVPTGDHILRRWLLRAAGVRVVEVPRAAWEEVVGHEAAAALLISDALREQAGI